MQRTGIAIAGNILVDSVKEIDRYPEKGMLSNIFQVSRSVGGCVPNTAINLAKMKSGIPIRAIGRAGADEPGRFVVEQLQAVGIDTEGVILSEQEATSFSDAMTVQETGERTFFHYRGANRTFSPGDVELDKLNCKILHIGYILLLDSFDAEEEEYGTVMARFLHDAQERGIETSIDVVSDSSGEFARKVTPALKYCDYAIMNEIEGCAVSGLAPRDPSGKLILENIQKTLEQFMKIGVRRRAVIHCPEAGFCMDRERGFCVVPSYRLPAGYIKGSVGAGDAFCAGCLHEIYLGSAPEQMLEYAAAAAAANLSRPDAVSGMREAGELRKMAAEWEKQEL